MRFLSHSNLKISISTLKIFPPRSSPKKQYSSLKQIENMIFSSKQDQNLISSLKQSENEPQLILIIIFSSKQ